MKDLERIGFTITAIFGAMLAWMTLAVMLVEPAHAAPAAAALTIHVQDAAPKGADARGPHPG